MSEMLLVDRILEEAASDSTEFMCDAGMWLPFLGELNEDGTLAWPRGLLMVLYLVGMLWMFLGVGIVADMFMAGIETVTSVTKTIKGPDGSEFEVKIWNDTVANLTLMALGSSAPEIMLSVIGIMASEYFIDDLGPSTIVGSAAFNLMIICGACMIAVPPPDAETGETGIRRIADMGVFTITACFSVFAYVWLLIILVYITPDYVDVWEGVLSFLFFPLVVSLAYAADRNWFKAEKVAPNGHIVAVNGHHFHAHEAADMLKAAGKHAAGGDAQEMASYLARMAMAQQKPSRAQLRINAMRQLTGGKRVVPGNLGKASDYIQRMPSLKELEEKPEVNFASDEYSVLESGGFVTVTVVRLPAIGTLSVKYETVSGTATAGQDFEAVSGVLDFAEGEEEKEIKIKIKDDDDVEDDETFSVRIFEPSKGEIGPYGSTTITIIDDDEPGEIGIKDKDAVVGVVENIGHVKLHVSRINGSSGEVQCDYETVSGTATQDVNFVPTKGTMVFKNGEVTRQLDIKIVNTEAYEINANFKLKLSNFKGPEGRSKGFAGHKTEIDVTITHDEATRAMVEDVTKMMNLDLEKYDIGTDSWSGQFKDAIFEIGCEDGETPATMDYVMHGMTVPFKVIYSIVPPTKYLNGWACFYGALVMVGLTTIVIGDIAALFGCVWGLDKATTAITFVALGTSLPDTFASMAATKGDDTADNAIGNVTGSNAVNVFLGLGLPWMMAAFKWSNGAPTADWYEKYGTPSYVDDNGVSQTIWAASDLPADSSVVWTDGNDKTCQDCAFKIAEVNGLGSARFVAPGGALGFSVTVFCCCAIATFAILMFRRATVGAELGGDPAKAKIHASCCILLWFVYIAMSILKNFGAI